MKVCMSCGHLTADESATSCPSCGRSELVAKESATPEVPEAKEAAPQGAKEAGAPEEEPGSVGEAGPDRPTSDAPLPSGDAASPQPVASRGPDQGRSRAPMWTSAAVAVALAGTVAVGTWLSAGSHGAADGGTAAAADGNSQGLADGGR